MNLQRIKHIAVIGAGLMGAGIAQSFAQAGYPTRLQGRKKESIERAHDTIRGNLIAFQSHGLIAAGEVQTILARIEFVTSLEESARSADFVVEAVPENMSIKKEVFAGLDKLCRPGVILASNTSGLSISEIASATARGAQVVGTHFWNPPHLIPLVEVVRGKQTSGDTLDVAAKLMQRIDKKPVIVNREVPGFIGTRLHQALIREAFYLVEQGIASLQDVDTVVKTSFGRRLGVTGPMETCDLGGLDVFLAAAEVFADLCNSSAPPRLMAEKVAQGDLGAKSGRGLYDWNAETIAAIKQERENVLIYYLKKDKAGACLQKNGRSHKLADCSRKGPETV